MEQRKAVGREGEKGLKGGKLGIATGGNLKEDSYKGGNRGMEKLPKGKLCQEKGRIELGVEESGIAMGGKLKEDKREGREEWRN